MKGNRKEDYSYRPVRHVLESPCVSPEESEVRLAKELPTGVLRCMTVRKNAKNGVRTWNNNVPMKDATRAIVDMEAGKTRYRIVLVNEKHAT